MRSPLPFPDLVDWFSANGRDLPWRRERDPWSITVAELMLQQTQVARVIDRWPRFLARFATAEACAAAPVGDVIDEWSGLGYNRRAVNLHRCAELIVSDHGGCIPMELVDLLKLPGIGPYTARAIRVFAFELDDGVVDTNVARILARVIGRPLGGAEVQALADRAVPEGEGWTWNQAMLDVGAGHCIPRNPSCGACPFRAGCEWRLAGHPKPDPAIRSANVSGPQSRFIGSDRQGRGRLVDALRRGRVDEAALAETMGWPDDEDRARRVAETVVGDGLAVVDESGYRLPGEQRDAAHHD